MRFLVSSKHPHLWVSSFKIHEVTELSSFPTGSLSENLKGLRVVFKSGINKR